MKRVAAMAFALLSVSVGVGACGADSPDTVSATVGVTASVSPAVPASPDPTPMVMARGIFISTTPPPSGVVNAYAYDGKIVPRSAAADLSLTDVDGRTRALLTVSGFRPSRSYGVHLQVNPCGVDPNAAGPHFQHNPDPAASRAPSTDPAFANPVNEVWLDFNTDPQGNASSGTEVPWVATAARHPNSLVIHADPTMTGPGHAGMAGAPVACLTIPF